MKAWELLSDCSKWTRGCYARNRNGTPCPVSDRHACQWCAMGAIIKCYGADNASNQHAVNRAQEAAARLYSGNLIAINDRQQHGAYVAVLSVLKEADV